MTTAAFPSKPINDTDANFRTWGLGLSTAIQAVGLVKTADTGQIDFVTVLKPTVSATMQGYEIFRFNDALQVTTPIFIKVEYGCGTFAATPALKITVGKDSNGTGTLTGIIHTQSSIQPAASSSNTYDSYVSSGDGSMLVFSLWSNTLTVSPAYMQCTRFIIERSRDSSGNATSIGTFCYRWDGSASSNSGIKSEASVYNTGAITLQNRTPIYTGMDIGVSTTTNNGTNTIMFNAEVLNPNREKWEPRSLLGYCSADAGILQAVSVGSEVYLTLGYIVGGYGDAAQSQYACIAIAYY